MLAGMNALDPGPAHAATYQDVLDAPPHQVAEIIQGALHLHPRPAFRHARASSILGARIGGPFDYDAGGPGGWWILDEPELHLDDDVVVPDIAGWRRERLPVFPDAPWTGIAPDWVCEVLSPSTRRLDLGPKRDIYARENAKHLWLVDPEARTLEAFVLECGGWRLIATRTDGDEVALPPFAAAPFLLSDLWPDAAATPA